MSSSLMTKKQIVHIESCHFLFDLLKDVLTISDIFVYFCESYMARIIIENQTTFATDRIILPNILQEKAQKMLH